MKKIGIIIILILLCLFGCGKLTVIPPNPQILRSIDSITLENYLKDAEMMVDTFENIHPAFPLNMIPNNYSARRDDFLNKASMPMCLSDFYYLANSYVALFKDMHGIVGITNMTDYIIPIKWKWKDEELIVMDDSILKSGEKIKQIGGISLEKLVQIVKSTIAYENDYGLAYNIEELLKSYNFLHYAGADLSDYSAVINESVKLGFELAPIDNNIERSVWAKEQDGKLLFNYGTSNIDETILNNAIDILKKYIANGGKDIIFDVRTNVGGHLVNNQKIYDALCLNLPSPEVSVYVPPIFSDIENNHKYMQFFTKIELDMWIKYFEELGKKTIDEIAGKIITVPSYRPDKVKTDLNIHVLVSKDTFSAGLWFAVNLQDGKTASIIGEPPHQAPDHFGYLAKGFKLPVSGMKYAVSSAFLRRSDRTFSSVLMPDILVPADMVWEYID